MKTLKITEETHKDLTDYIAYFYKKTGVKMTLNEAIATLLIYHNKTWEMPLKETVNLNDK